MLVAANANLGRTHDRDQIGVTVLDINGNVVTPWSRAGVKLDFPGWWSVVGGVTVPDDGGLVRWSTERGEHIAQEDFLPMPVFDVAAITRRIDALTQGLTSATTAAVGEMADRQTAVAELVSAQLDDIRAIRAWCDQIAGISRIGAELDAMQSRLGRLVGGVVSSDPSPISELAAAERAQYEAKIAALQSKLNSAVQAIDFTLEQMELRGIR